MPLTVSIGIAPLTTDRDASASLKEADMALLQGQGAGPRLRGAGRPKVRRRAAEHGICRMRGFERPRSSR
jgi:GGDEF domain-containing protein